MTKLFVSTPAEVAAIIRKTGQTFDDVMDVPALCVHFGGYTVDSALYQACGEPRNLRNYREMVAMILSGELTAMINAKLGA